MVTYQTVAGDVSSNLTRTIMYEVTYKVSAKCDFPDCDHRLDFETTNPVSGELRNLGWTLAGGRRTSPVSHEDILTFCPQHSKEYSYIKKRLGR